MVESNTTTAFAPKTKTSNESNALKVFGSLVIFAFVLNIIPIALSAGVLAGIDHTHLKCGKATSWLFVNLVLCAINICLSFFRFGSLYLKSFSRLAILLSIIESLGFLIWLLIGAVWWYNGDMSCSDLDDNEPELSYELNRALMAAITCGFILYGLPCCMCCCTWSCACCYLTCVLSSSE